MTIIYGMIVLLTLLCSVPAQAQSIKEVYKSVKKAELAANIRATKSFNDAVIEARTEFDLFNGSEEAKKNPEFARHIEAALANIRKAYALSWQMDHGFSGAINQNPPPGSTGVQSLDEWNKIMAQAASELEAGKHYLK